MSCRREGETCALVNGSHGSGRNPRLFSRRLSQNWSIRSKNKLKINTFNCGTLAKSPPFEAKHLLKMHLSGQTAPSAAPRSPSSQKTKQKVQNTQTGQEGCTLLTSTVSLLCNSMHYTLSLNPPHLPTSSPKPLSEEILLSKVPFCARRPWG